MPETATTAKAEQSWANRTPSIADDFMVSSSIPSQVASLIGANDLRKPLLIPTIAARPIALAAGRKVTGL
jgi:hypothetical protein